MASDNSPCVSEVTSAISRIRMGNNSDTKGPRVENDAQTPSSSPQTPGTPVLDNTENHIVDSFRLRMLNSASNCSSPIRENTKAVSDIQIPIVGYEVMEERARFTVYKLRIEHKSSGNCWYVFRRYTDFVRLHSKLRTEFPDAKLQLPRKRWFGDNFDPAFLSDRIKGLQGFVNAILNHQELCGAQAVKEFFCLDEPPSYTESLEESRAIFEALEETIYHLRSQLREKETELTRMRFTLDIEMKKNNRILQQVRTAVEKCTTCSQVLPILDGPNLTSTPVKTVGPKLTSTPVKTVGPKLTSTPVKTVGPKLTSTPVKTAGPNFTSTPIKTVGPNLTSTPVKTAGPDLTSTPVKTADKTQAGVNADTQVSESERSSAGSHH